MHEDNWVLLLAYNKNWSTSYNHMLVSLKQEVGEAMTSPSLLDRLRPRPPTFQISRQLAFDHLNCNNPCSQSIVHYQNKMVSTASVPLNAEPSQPDEREKQHLVPKSYVDAVQEEPPVNGTNGTNGTNSNGNKVTSESEWLKPSPTHKASVLRIVDTGADGKEKETEKEGERPQYERQESKNEYLAAVRLTLQVSPTITNSSQGLDDTLRPPPKQKHRRQKSGSQEKKSADDETKTNGVNNAKQPKVKYDRENTTVFEKVEGTQNGSKLISVKPDPEFEKDHRTDRKETPKPSKEELASGKKPGQRWHNSGIRFAPLNVPLQRRLQTLIVLFHTLCIALSVSVFFFLCAIPIFWPLLIPYMIYCMTSTASTSGTLSHRSDFLRSLPIWSLFASYFPARLHRTQELPPTRKYIFGYHPHGILSLGAFGAFATEALGFSQLFPGIRNTLLTLDSNFRIPIYRDYALAMGVASVSKESCENLLSKGGLNKVCLSLAVPQTSSLT
jgi:2-acylglycerol O-acyltransferase 2